jgi:histidinol-phosphatase (PHP family)
MFLSMGGRFVMSDDSHGIDHIATNYARMLDFINRAGIKQMHYASRDATSTDPRFPHTGFSSMPVEQLSQLPFWTKDQ